MKIVISERQYKLLNEGDSPIKIGCHDYKKIPNYCGTLKMTKQHGDTIISNNRENAKKDLMIRLDKLIESAKKESEKNDNKESKKITDKFTEAIESIKSDIIKYLDNIYPNAVYAAIGIQNKLDTNKLMSYLVKILYDAFVKVWDDSYVIRNIADFFVTKENIGVVLEQSKYIWHKWLDNFMRLIHIYFLYNMELPIRNFVVILNESASLPICKKVIITADVYCKKLARDKWYHPKMEYSYGYTFDKSVNSDDIITSINGLYWPKVSSILKKLV